MASLKEQYKNQKDRIRKAIKDIQKTGASFDKSLEDIVGKRPKRITQASVNKLKKITKDDLYRMAKKPDGSSAWSERMKKREQAARKGGKAAQAKKRQKIPPTEPPEPIEPWTDEVIHDETGENLYQAISDLIRDNIELVPELQEIQEALDDLRSDLSPMDFAKWANKPSVFMGLPDLISREIKYRHVPNIRHECHNKALDLIYSGRIPETQMKTTTDENGEKWMDLSAVDLEEDFFFE